MSMSGKDTPTDKASIELFNYDNHTQVKYQLPAEKDGEIRDLTTSSIP